MFEVLQDGISLARDFRTYPGKECAEMDLGVFIPIGNNGWLISTACPPSVSAASIAAIAAATFAFAELSCPAPFTSPRVPDFI